MHCPALLKSMVDINFNQGFFPPNQTLIVRHPSEKSALESKAVVHQHSAKIKKMGKTVDLWERTDLCHLLKMECKYSIFQGLGAP